MSLKPSNQLRIDSHTSEEELVSLFIQTGQNHYLGKLYNRCSDRVYYQCLSMVQDPVQAQDYTHDIFLKLISKLSTFKGNSRFSSWLSSVTYNYCRDQYRAGKRRKEILIDEFAEFAELADDCTPGYSLQDEPVELNILTQAISCLTADEKMILKMRYTDNLSLITIAGTFNLSLSAVKMRLLRSQKKLRHACYESSPVRLETSELLNHFSIDFEIARQEHS